MLSRPSRNVQFSAGRLNPGLLLARAQQHCSVRHHIDPSVAVKVTEGYHSRAERIVNGRCERPIALPNSRLIVPKSGLAVTASSLPSPFMSPSTTECGRSPAMYSTFVANVPSPFPSSTLTVVAAEEFAVTISNLPSPFKSPRTRAKLARSWTRYDVEISKSAPSGRAPVGSAPWPRAGLPRAGVAGLTVVQAALPRLTRSASATSGPASTAAGGR